MKRRRASSSPPPLHSAKRNRGSEVSARVCVDVTRRRRRRRRAALSEVGVNVEYVLTLGRECGGPRTEKGEKEECPPLEC